MLSNFQPTADTSTRRVAALFDGFPGLRNIRAVEPGAEWIYRDVQALTAVPRCAIDHCHPELPGDSPLLRVWMPDSPARETESPIEVTLARADQMLPPRVRRADPMPTNDSEQCFTLHTPLRLSAHCEDEWVYQLPPSLALEPKKKYRISGRTDGRSGETSVFEFTFHTDKHGLPVVQ